MLVYYIDPNDKELVNNSEFIKEFLENNFKTPHRFVSIEEYETLTAIASLDLSLELKNRDRFTNIKVDTLYGILMRIYGDNKPSADLILNSINMAFSNDKESSILGLCLLIKTSLTSVGTLTATTQFLRELCAFLIYYRGGSHDLIKIYSLSIVKIKNIRVSNFLYKLLTRNIRINNNWASSDTLSLSNYYKLVMEKINPEFAKLM